MRKKLVAMCMAAMMALGAAAPAYAANTSDMEYEFYITATYKRTPGREKTNTTKVYTYYYDGPWHLAFQTYGATSENGAGTNKTKGGTVYIEKDDPSSITNYIKEDGFSYAYLRVNSADEDGMGYTARGVWSPDSSRNYHVVN